jgi:2-keto-4-pentenoate hydratase/2-oxohepta-3-ene-1,7-dioic acid hydratase in catechol pathway
VRLATFESSSEAKLGAVIDGGETVVDLQAAQQSRGDSAPALESMLALIEAGDSGLELVRELIETAPAERRLPRSRVRLLAPLPRPSQIRDFLCFEEHLKNSFAQAERLTGQPREIPGIWYEQPIYYKANRFSVIGPDEDVVWPSYSVLMDYELELACVIGREGRDIDPKDAAAHIFGFTIFNDASARDAQMAEMAGQLGPAKGKDFDTGNVLGPWIVTADEIGDPHALTMVARVNGEEWSRGSSGAMHHRFEDMIAFVSRSETLYSGEVLGSGTVGTGCGLELGRFLEPGDLVELEIERIGVLRNRFVRTA